MARKRGSSGELGEAYGHAALGFTFAAGVVVFTVIGWLIDRRFGVVPIFTVVGALVGAVLSFLSVYFRIRSEERAARDHRREQKR